MTPDFVDQLAEIVHSTASALLSSRASETAPEVQPDPGPLVSEVSIRGCWNGKVVIVCERALARLFAMAMFDADDPAPGDVEDAMAELANIVAGNFKSLVSIESTCTLSIPIVVEHAPEPATINVRFEVVGRGLNVLVQQKAVS